MSRHTHYAIETNEHVFYPFPHDGGKLVVRQLLPKYKCKKIILTCSGTSPSQHDSVRTVFWKLLAIYCQQSHNNAL